MSQAIAAELKLSQAARVAKRSPDRLRRLVAGGAITGRQSETGQWYVDEGSLHEYLAREAEQQPLGVPPELADLAHLADHFHALSVTREAILNSLAGEADAAARTGNEGRAMQCGELAKALRAAEYTWQPDRRTWRLEVPGHAPRETRPAPMPGDALS